MRKSFKNNSLFIVFILLSLGLLSACSNSNTASNKTETKEGVKQESRKEESVKNTFQNITPEEVYKKMKAGEEMIILDVRTREEYETGYIEKAMLIPVDQLEQEAEKQLKDKKATIVIYCRSGNRSVTAANILIEKGYENVYNLGGIQDWPYEVVK